MKVADFECLGRALLSRLGHHGKGQIFEERFEIFYRRDYELPRNSNPASLRDHQGRFFVQNAVYDRWRRTRYVQQWN